MQNDYNVLNAGFIDLMNLIKTALLIVVMIGRISIRKAVENLVSERLERRHGDINSPLHTENR
jgi:hypothetical protein